MPNYCKRIALIGMFDGVHRGHQALVDDLCRLADQYSLVPTVFTFDRHPLELIAPERAPYVITTPAQRGDLLELYGVTDVFVLAFNKTLRAYSAADFMNMLHSQYGVERLLLGFNHRFGNDRLQHDNDYIRLGQQCGVEVSRSDVIAYDEATHQAISSSSVRALLGAGDIVKANNLMGHSMALRGVIRHGNALGRTIGYPTANLQLVVNRQLVPPCGVYAGRGALVDGSIYPAMINIGKNPTLIKEDDTDVRIEAHLIGFEGNLYERVIDIDIVDRIRDERLFPSPQDLKAQIDTDKQAILNILNNTK